MKTFKGHYAFLVGKVFLTFSITGHAAPNIQQQVANQSLNYLLDSTIQLEDIKNTTLLVDSPKHDFFWHEARGLANPETNEAMQPNTPYRIASITKTFTATRIMQLIEEGRLSLDTKVSDILTNADMPAGKTINALSKVGGVMYGDSITVRQLLNHTSGLRDYIFDSANPSDYRSLAYFMVLDVFGVEDNGLSTTQWTPEKILSYYFDTGASDHALYLPGQTHHYGDTNYLLLSMIIEKITGNSLADNFRSNIYSTAEIDNTYLYWYEPSYRQPIAHHFWRLTLPHLGINENLDIVKAGVNTSNDWGGGGIVSTASSLNKYNQALFNNRLFVNEKTLSRMITENVPTDSSTERYGLGIRELSYDINGKSIKVYGHAGIWGTGMYYLPQTKTSIVFAVNQVTLEANPLESILLSLDNARFFDLIAVDDEVQSPMNQPISLNVLANDSSQLDIDRSTLRLVGTAQHGTAILSPVTGMFYYEPNEGFNGVEELFYEVCDSHATVPACMQAKISLNFSQSLQPVPSLSFYGLLLLSALLGFIGFQEKPRFVNTDKSSS